MRRETARAPRRPDPPTLITGDLHCCHGPSYSATYKGTRPHIAFRYNLFEHLGDISTLRTAKTPVYAACYEQLLDPVLFEVRQPGGWATARVSLTRDLVWWLWRWVGVDVDVHTRWKHSSLQNAGTRTCGRAPARAAARQAP